MLEFISSMPEPLLNNIFTTINTLVCGLIVAIFTSTFLKKKEERTRIAGVIVEKRINSEQQILEFLERELFKMEMTIDNSKKYEHKFSMLLASYHLPDPYGGRLQYAKIFEDRELFEKFFHDFEAQISTNKLWLDTKVRKHLIYMQMYFSVFNTIPLMVKRIPLPKGNELSDTEFDKVCNKVLLLLGASCDAEINGLMNELDEKIVDSVYKLELKRPRKSIMRDNMQNAEIASCLKRIYKRTTLGRSQYDIFQLVMDMVYEIKGIDDSKMTNEENDEFLKSVDPQLHEELQEEMLQFEEIVEKAAKESGVEIVHKDELDQYPDCEAISLRELLMDDR